MATETITWTTNEPATSQVEYGLTTGYGTITALDTTLVTSHSVALLNLTAGATYHFRVRDRDAQGNLAVSADATFIAAGGSGPTISNVAASAITITSATIIWTTSVPATSQVEYGPTTSYGATTALDTALVTNHSVMVSGLVPSTIYHYRVRSTV